MFFSPLYGLGFLFANKYHLYDLHPDSIRLNHVLQPEILRLCFIVSVSKPMMGSQQGVKHASNICIMFAPSTAKNKCSFAAKFRSKPIWTVVVSVNPFIVLVSCVVFGDKLRESNLTPSTTCQHLDRRVNEIQPNTGSTRFKEQWNWKVR